MTFYRACIRHVFASLLLCAAFISFSGNAFAYCASRGTTSYEWIKSIGAGGIVRVSGNNGGYISFTQPVINLYEGINRISLTPAFSGLSHIEYWKIWIDFNNNDVFEADEAIYSGSSRSTLNSYMRIPSTATSGERRMRISMRRAITPTPCGSYSYGEVEDYRVYIHGTDVTPPAIVSKTPAAGAVEAPLDTVITVNFSENLDPASVSDSSISLKLGGYLDIDGTVSVNGATLVFTPAEPLYDTADYQVTVHAGLRDSSGNATQQDETWSFMTVDRVPPVIRNLSQSGGPTGAYINVTFSEPLDPRSVTYATVQLSTGGTIVPGEIFLSGDRGTIQFHSSQALDYATAYTVKIEGARDMAGNVMTKHASAFITRNAPLPYCASSGNATQLWIETVKVGNFSYFSISNPGYSDYSHIVFELSKTNPTPLQLTLGATMVHTSQWRVFIDWNQDFVFSEDELAFSAAHNISPSGSIEVPEHALPGNTRMRVSLESGYSPQPCGNLTYGEVKDYSVNIPGPAGDMTPPQVIATVPADGAQGVDIDPVISADFSEIVYERASDGFLTLHGGTIGWVVARAFYDFENRRLVVTPEYDLEYSTTYTLTLSGLSDLAGNALPDYSWSFTTRPDPGPAQTVSGSVLLYQGGGAGVAGVTISLSGDSEDTAVTDANGHYSLSVKPGSYLLTASKEGYIFSNGPQFEVADAAVSVDHFDAAVIVSPLLNGDFETGDFSGFTLYATSNGDLSWNVPTLDIDGNGVASKAAKIHAHGNDPYNGQYHGGGMYQMLDFNAGELYVKLTVAVDSTAYNGLSGLAQVFFDDQLVASHDFGIAGTATTRVLSFLKEDVAAGRHQLRIQFTHPEYTTSSFYVDDIVMMGSSTQN